MATARLMLVCHHCGDRWPDDAVMEAVRLHMQVEHDTDEVEVDMILACACNARMALTRKEPLRNGRERHHYDCPACKRSTTLMRNKEA